MEQPIGSELPAPLEAAPDYKLYTPDQVGLATFLGSALAGGYLLYQNSRRLGRPTLVPLALGIGATLLAIGLALVTPVGAGIAIGLVFAMRQLAQGEQGARVREHQQKGGKLESGWNAAGVGVISALMVLSLGFVGGTGYDMLMSRSLKVSENEEIQYQRGVPVDQAQALGAFLQKIGYFNGKNTATVCLRKDGSDWVVGFVVKDGIWDQPSMVDAFGVIGKAFPSEVFHNEPVKVELLDANLEAHKTL